MPKKIDVPEAAILAECKDHVYWTVEGLCSKFSLSEYMIRKVLKKHNIVRVFAQLEDEIRTKFLKYESLNNVNAIGREKMFARKLVEKYPDKTFWTNIKLGFQLNSLAWFLGPAGSVKLKTEWGKFKFEIPVNASHNIGTEKIGEDAEVVSKPKSIHEFLRR